MSQFKARAKDAHFYATGKISDRILVTPEGYLLCIAVPIARSGDLTYAKGELLDDEGNEVIEAKNGLFIVNRSNDDLFDPSAMASFEGKPITIDHPADFVCPATYDSVAVGHMQNIRPGTGADADKLLADFMVVDASACQMIQAGLREVSLGYDAEYEQIEPGLGRQTNIVGNHAALVRKGRNGSEVAVRDSAPDLNPRSNTMKTKEPKTLKANLMALFGRTLDEAMPDTAAAAPADDNSPDARMSRIEDVLEKLVADKTATAADEPVVVADELPGAEADPAVAARLDKIEALLAKLLGMDDDAGAVAVDAKAKDAAVKTADAETVSMAEIIAPGLVASPTLVTEALTVFGATTVGAAVMKTFDSITDEKSKFTAVVECVKATRAAQLTVPTIDNFPGLKAVGAMSPQQINEANVKHYGLK